MVAETANVATVHVNLVLAQIVLVNLTFLRCNTKCYGVRII